MLDLTVTSAGAKALFLAIDSIGYKVAVMILNTSLS
jgi:hypothetical protein